jgi:beta-xylosidase
MKYLATIVWLGIVFHFNITAQDWVPDVGNGKYKNPILYADYSDPDIIRAGDDFYLVASSFNCMPGIPILHSNDLVNWKIINHVYQSLPLKQYDKPVHGQGSWAPSIRYHNNKFYVYFCTPNEGLFMASADNPAGEWELHLVEAVEKWEDPCPIWDDDGNAYLVRSKVCGNELFLHKLSSDGKKLLDNGTLIYKDTTNPTIEGPKFLKKDGYYYILAPAGGVPIGWQTVLRSKNIYGPYEAKKVLQKGNSLINGPHQGGAVELKSGEWWFVHFQSRDFYGRIVHLQPMKWENGWPMIGVDQNNDGIGEPVTEFKKPDVGKTYPVVVPQTSDEFNEQALGLQWQWHANPKSEWYSLQQNNGKLRLNAVKNFSQNGNLWFVPNLLLQKFSMPSFMVTTIVDFHSDLQGEKCGLVIMGKQWAYVALVNDGGINKIVMSEGKYIQCNDETLQIESVPVNINSCFLRVSVSDAGICKFSYSLDNKSFTPIGRDFKAESGIWIGTKVGLFCVNPNITESKGYAEFDWFRVE